MTNTTVMIMLGTLAGVVFMILVLSLAQRLTRNVERSFNLFALSILGWLLCDVAYYGAGSPAAINYLFNLRIPFVAFSAVAELCMVMRYYRLDALITKRFVLLLSIVPAITTLLALTSPLHPLLRMQQEVLQVEPMHIMLNVRGVWFWVHAGYCYILTVASAVVLVRQHRKLPAGYRMPSYVLGLAMVIILAANVVSVWQNLPVDITEISMGIAVILIYISIINSSKSDLLVIARDEVFNSLDECVFVRDLQQQVLDANVAARRWLDSLGIAPVFPFTFARVFEVLRSKGATIRENADNNEGTDIYYSTDDYGMVYNLRERFVYDKSDKPIGVYSMLMDVTRFRLIIDRLERTAEIDSLTGLANRRAFDNLKKQLDQNQTMPLALVLGDANGLKQVNDQLGHAQGDALLRVLAQQIRACTPPGALAARIGGDEFAICLPGYGEADATHVAARIQEGICARGASGEYPFVPSIALGVAERKAEDGVPEKIDNLVRRADVTMYQNKENDRRANRRARRNE